MDEAVKSSPIAYGTGAVQEVPVVDIEFLKRYDTPGPRYTSYPTAPVFSNSYTDKLFEVDLITNNHENAHPFSLYIHIPFCDTLCYFCGCTTVITSNGNRIEEYLGVLQQEISKVRPYFHPSRRITQMHWGGGSPSALSPSQIDRLGEFLRTKFEFEPDAEVSVELDPRGLSQEHMRAFRTLGVNRISLGVQDFNERVQKAVNRVQPAALTTQAIAWARELGIRHVNVDLIYGLPLQTVSSFETTLRRVIDINPGRVAVYNFAHVPWIKPHQKLIHSEDLPSPEVKLLLLKTSIDVLTQAGYEYVGMDHFAKPDDELVTARRNKTLHRNFQGYSTKAGVDLFGIGMSSISHFGNVYSQNMKTLKEYSEAVRDGRFPIHVGYRMNRDDMIRKHVIMKLMCDLEVSTSEVERRFSVSFDEYFEAAIRALRDFEDQALVRRIGDRLRVEGAGRFVLRNIAMCFDAYLPAMRSSRPIFSRTV